MTLAKKPFVVLDAEILSSSVWSESAAVRLVWITLLILCDTDGYVGAAVPGIATAAGVSLLEAEEALQRLQQPDPYSRTTANDGRRVEPAERGFRILNFMEHLDRLSSERTKARDRVRRHRERNAMKRSNEDRNVTVLAENRDQGPETREKGKETSDRTSTDLAAPSGARVVFDYWREVHQHRQAILTPKRKRLIEQRLKDGYDVARLRAAIDGCRLDPFSQGENDRHVKFDDIALICRDGEHVEKFERIATEGLTRGASTDTVGEHNRRVFAALRAK